MKRIVFSISLFLFLFFSLLVLVVFKTSDSVVSLIFNSNPFFEEEINFLLLGKPGPGYIGSENTDSILIFHYLPQKNTLYLIPIPRDLIVKDRAGKFTKINSLYGEKKIDLLLEKASDFSGLRIKNYLAFDITLIKNLVDLLGRLEIKIKEPISDAVTLYTISPGEHKLNGDLIELVLRSRYHNQGDFFRMRNQIEVIKAFKDRWAKATAKEKLDILNFLKKHRYHWQSNLTLEELIKITYEIHSNLDNLKIVPIIIDTKTGLLKSGSFNIMNSRNVYGLYPKLGVDNYKAIQIYVKAKINE